MVPRTGLPLRASGKAMTGDSRLPRERLSGPVAPRQESRDLSACPHGRGNPPRPWPLQPETSRARTRRFAFLTRRHWALALKGAGRQEKDQKIKTRKEPHHD